MPVWKFPQIYVEFTATVVPLQMGVSGYAAYGIVQPIYAEITFPAFDAEGSQAALGEIQFPVLEVEGLGGQRVSVFGEVTSPAFNAEGAFGLAGEAQFPAFQNESFVAAGTTFDGEVSISPVKAEGIVSVENFISSELTFSPFSCEGWTGSIGESEFPVFSVEADGVPGAVLSGDLSISGIAIESNVFAEQPMTGEANFSALSAEGYCGSIAIAEMSAWANEGFVNAQKIVDGQLTFKLFEVNGTAFMITPLDGSVSIPSVQGEGLISGDHYDTVIFGMHKDFF